MRFARMKKVPGAKELFSDTGLNSIDRVVYVSMTLQKINEAEVLGQFMPSKTGGSNPRAASVDISILDLINGVKIYDYDMQRDDTYTPADIRYSFQGKNP